MSRTLSVLDVVTIFLLLEVIKESIKFILWKKEQDRHRKVMAITGDELKDFLSKLEEEMGEDDDK